MRHRIDNLTIEYPVILDNGVQIKINLENCNNSNQLIEFFNKVINKKYIINDINKQNFKFDLNFFIEKYKLSNIIDVNTDKITKIKI